MCAVSGAKTEQNSIRFFVYVASLLYVANNWQWKCAFVRTLICSFIFDSVALCFCTLILLIGYLGIEKGCCSSPKCCVCWMQKVGQLHKNP